VLEVQVMTREARLLHTFEVDLAEAHGMEIVGEADQEACGSRTKEFTNNKAATASLDGKLSPLKENPACAVTITR